jgi:tetratricopeptide (TPR) repeat protein
MSNSRALEVPKRGVLPRRPRLHMLAPNLTALFTGACTLMLVLAASRLVARSVGSSLYTWTSILGVVLAGVATGHFLGGRLADRYDGRRALAVLFGLSSAACVGMVVANNIAADWLGLWWLGWPSHVFIHVVFVLFVPTVLLGAVYPILAKMVVGGAPVPASGGIRDRGPGIGSSPTQIRPVPSGPSHGIAMNVGRTIGRVYAWGAVGGTVGTFLTGFSLGVVFGNTAIIWLIGTALLAVAVLYWVSCWAMYLWAMVFLALATMGMSGDQWAREVGAAAWLRERPDPNVVYEAQTRYCRVAVRQVSRRPDRRAFVQDGLTRSEITVNDAAHPVHFHLKVFVELTRGLSAGRKNPALLILGAGGYALPRHLRAVWPDSRVDVVEVDPGVTRAASAAFGLEKATGIATIHMDARCYVDRLAKARRAGKPAQQYDFIYQDAVGDIGGGFELTTKEFNDQIAGLLADNGIYLVHLLDTDGCLVGAVVNTVEETFPRVYVIAEQADLRAAGGSVVVIAARQRLDPRALLGEQDRYLVFSVLSETQITDLRQRCGRIILTDDYAPVENLLAPAVKYRARELLAHKYLGKAQQLQAENQYERSIRWYGGALRTDPSLAVRAYTQIGLINIARDRPEEAEAAFRQALAAHAAAGDRATEVGAVHMHLGILLGRMGRPREAKEQSARAVQAFRTELGRNPNAVVAWEQLGETAAALGDFQSASDAFERAAALEPRNPSHYQKLARALELQHRYPEAIAAVQKHVEIVKELGRRDLVVQLTQYMDLLKYQQVKQPK